MNRSHLSASNLVLALCAVLGSGGCGTTLTVSQVDKNALTPGRVTQGIVVNRKQRYRATVEFDLDGPFGSNSAPAPASDYVTLLDPTFMLALDICRLPFFDGNLSLKLHKDQTLSVVAVTGEPGVARALDAANASLDARNKVQELRHKDDDEAESE